MIYAISRLEVMLIATAIIGVLSWKNHGQVHTINQAFIEFGICWAVFNLGRFCHEHGVDFLSISSESERKFKFDISTIKQQLEFAINCYQKNHGAPLPGQAELQEALQSLSYHQYRNDMLAGLKRVDGILDNILDTVVLGNGADVVADKCIVKI